MQIRRVSHGSWVSTNWYMLLHTCTNILVKKLFGNDLVRRFSYLSLTIWLAEPVQTSGAVFHILCCLWLIFFPSDFTGRAVHFFSALWLYCTASHLITWRLQKKNRGADSLHQINYIVHWCVVASWAFILETCGHSLSPVLVRSLKTSCWG